MNYTVAYFSIPALLMLVALAVSIVFGPIAGAVVGFPAGYIFTAAVQGYLRRSRSREVV